MATMKEIAKICGVSVATVSKALNGYDDIGEKTAVKVLETAKKIGYQPNTLARALKTNRTYNLGVLFVDNMGSGLEHEYFSAILENFKKTSESLGYDITFISRNLGNNPMTYLEHSNYRRCDAVLVACANFKDPQIIELINSNIPTITVDYVFDSKSSVLSDNVEGMKTLVNYIYSLGHKDIAFIHGEDTSVTQKRLAGFYLKCKELNIDVNENFVKPARYHDPKSSAAVTRELLTLDKKPTCIIYPDDFSYIGGMNVIEEEFGYKIPFDISTAGYDGIYLSQVLQPRLTTIKQDAAQIGITASKKLIQSIEEPKIYFPEQIMIKGDLLKGDTVKNLL